MGGLGKVFQGGGSDASSGAASGAGAANEENPMWKKLIGGMAQGGLQGMNQQQRPQGGGGVGITAPQQPVLSDAAYGGTTKRPGPPGNMAFYYGYDDNNGKLPLDRHFYGG